MQLVKATLDGVLNQFLKNTWFSRIPVAIKTNNTIIDYLDKLEGTLCFGNLMESKQYSHNKETWSSNYSFWMNGRTERGTKTPFGVNNYPNITNPKTSNRLLLVNID